MSFEILGVPPLVYVQEGVQQGSMSRIFFVDEFISTSPIYTCHNLAKPTNPSFVSVKYTTYNEIPILQYVTH